MQLSVEKGHYVKKNIYIYITSLYKQNFQNFKIELDFKFDF